MTCGVETYFLPRCRIARITSMHGGVEVRVNVVIAVVSKALVIDHTDG